MSPNLWESEDELPEEDEVAGAEGVPDVAGVLLSAIF